VPSKSKRTPRIFSGGRIGGLEFTFRFSFQALFFLAPSAQFPDDALGSELAVTAGVGAGLALIQAFLAISDFHLAAFDGGITIGMVKAFHGVSSYPLVFLSRNVDGPVKSRKTPHLSLRASRPEDAAGGSFRAARRSLALLGTVRCTGLPRLPASQ
jgi:hypothetical protein